MKKLLFSGFFAITPLAGLLASNLCAASTMPQDRVENADTQKNGVKWEDFKSEESGFSVRLPAKPEHIKQTIDVPNTNLQINYETYVSEPNESSVFVVSVWHYPAEIDMSHPEVNLHDGFEGMLSALPGSKVIKMEMGDIGGFKALEFLVKNDGIFFQGKLILVHNTLYQVFTVYKENIDMKKDYESFINSFKLISPNKNKVKPQNGARKLNV